MCRLHHGLCLCPELPRLVTDTSVTVVMHRHEQHKTSNTGRLAARCLARGRVVVRRPRALDDDAILAGLTRPVLLFPGAGARPLHTLDTRTPVDLIVLDATWRQAIRMARRVRGLPAVPAVSLPPGGPSRYGLRTGSSADRVSTFEAIARALGHLDGSRVEQALNEVFLRVIHRIEWIKGRRRREDVHGGIPDGVKAHDPWSGPAGERALASATRAEH